MKNVLSIVKIPKSFQIISFKLYQSLSIYKHTLELEEPQVYEDKIINSYK